MKRSSAFAGGQVEVSQMQWNIGSSLLAEIWIRGRDVGEHGQKSRLWMTFSSEGAWTKMRAKEKPQERWA